MKIILTGSLGNIGKPLTETLVQNKHDITVISSDPEKKSAIEALGATAAIGSLEDEDFLSATFEGAEAVYCMVPPAGFSEPDRVLHYGKLAHNYAKAIVHSGVKRVVHLSSYGADLDKGTGLILGAYHAEQILNAIPDIDLTHIRPAYFYYNLNNFIDMIKNAGVMKANYGEEKIVLVSPIDIAAVIADEVVKTSDVQNVRYVSSDSRTGSEVAKILGTAIGKPDLQWEIISDETAQNGYETNGFPKQLATDFVEMFASIRNGKLTEDYYRNEPKSGKVKLEDFAVDFAAAFHQK